MRTRRTILVGAALCTLLLALLVIILWSNNARAPESEQSPTGIPSREGFRGPTSTPNIKGPTTPPPQL